MPARVRFDAALRNALKAQKSRPQDHEHTTRAVVSPVSAGEPQPAGRLKRIIHERAVQMRHFLVGNVQYHVSELQNKLLQVQLQLDERLTRLEGRFAPLEARLEGRFATLDARLEARFATLEAKLAPLAMMPAQLDNLSLKVRSPLVIDESTLAIRVADGYAMVPRRDALLLVMLADSPSGALEPGTRSVMLRLLEAGMTFVDVGAHIGLHTLAAARKVGPSGRVYAFEPTPATFELLKRTITLNALTEVVRPKMLAIGARAARRTLYLHSISGHNSFYAPSSVGDGESQAIEVEVDTLDSALPSDHSIDLVKIDVEGAELDVLAGMGRIIADNRDLAI